MAEKTRQLRDVCIGDVMARPVETAHLHESLDTALDRMLGQNASLLPVVDGDRLVGLVSAAEIRAHAGKMAEVKVSDVATLGPYHCFEHDTVAAAAKTMSALGVAHLAVLDEEEKLVGMVGAKDLAGARGNQARPIDQRRKQDQLGSKPSDRDAFEEEHPGLQVYSDRPRLKR